MSRRKRDNSPASSRKRSRIRKVSSSSSGENESDGDGESTSQLSATPLSQAGSIERAIIHDIQQNVRSGKILKIQLKNFMCHRNLVVEFNKRANLLVGNNGSGKSAVLAALTIGLGCSANLTNRSSSVKQLIKHGESQASIEIHLENDSFDAFERDVYGDKIIIVRTINASGATSYKLKNETGSVISTSRSELLKMILYLNIQVDNPVCVLNQDLARSFLKDSDEKKQYNLFLKATQIDAITSKLNGCTPQLENAKHNLECNEKSLQYIEREIENMQEKYENLQSVEKLKDLVKKSRLKLSWRVVTDQSAECSLVEDKLRNKLNTMKEHMHSIQNREAIEAEVDRTVQRFRNDIDGKKTSFGELKDKYIQARKVGQQLQEQLSDKSRQMKKVKDRMARQAEDIKNLETDLKQRSESGFNRVADEKRRNEQMLADLTEKKRDLQAMVENAKRDVDALHNTMNQINEAKEEANNKRAAKHHERTRTEMQLQQFENSSRDNLSVFGQKMPAFVAKIKQMHQQGRFSDLPRGPLGQYIKVKNKKWTAMIETVIGPGMLTAFYVNSDADRTVLNQLIQREFPEMRGRTIITSRFHKEMYDVRAGRVEGVQDAHLLMDLISVSDPVVMNCLIDQIKIETILAVEDQNLAIDFTSHAENVPRNLQKVVVMEPFSEFYPVPNYRSYGLQKRPARYLQVNMAELKKQTERRMQQLDQELQEIKQQIEVETQKQNDKQRSLHDKQRQLTKQQQELNTLELKINELKAIEYPAESEDMTLQNELDELKASQVKLNEELELEKSKLGSFMQEIAVQERNIQEKKDHMTKIESEMQEIQDKIDAELQKRHDMQANSKTKQQQLERLREEVQTLQSKRNELKQALDTVTHEAQELGERIEVTETQEQLKKTISTTEKRIKHINSANDDIVDVKAILDNKLMKRDTALRYTDSLKKVIKTLYNSRVARYAYIHKLKSHMSLRVKHKFNMVMQLRGFVGEILMDTKNCTLALSVVPRDKNISNAVSNTKSLSGGERSYSTVAFLIALWSCVDTPFYFLDEYDVFTDQVNRHMMTMLLLNETKKKSDRQFCFLTPHREARACAVRFTMKWTTLYLTVIVLAFTTVCTAFESFRLPNATIPTHYDLFIDTDIHNDNLDYNGTVKISINVLEDTNQLVLHSSRSTLVDVVLKDDNHLPIPVINHEFENTKEFLVVNVASVLQNGSRVVLEIDFLNSINRTDQAGFYRTSYSDNDGKLKYAGLTQFQACEARSSFPCYDEPGIKATFDVRIACGVDYHARSNAEIASIGILPEGKKLVTFKRTPPMQTYLLAFLVSDFAVMRDFTNSTKKLTVQSMARPTHADQLLFSLDASVKMIDELQKYFDHPYELSKIDSVGIRNNDFSAGAMENWGLVTYLESYFLISDSSNDNNRRAVTTVIAHEFAHQFFGNLMAPKWWSYLWLNEGFATLYEYYLSDRTHPELLIKQRFPSGALQAALQVDGSTTIRSMTHYVETVQEIDRLFDRIAYEKSGSVLRMMHYALGEQTFLKGLKHYIKQKQNSVVEPQDLFDSLQKAAIDDQVLPPNSSMTLILESWSNQPGVPVVTVRRTSGSDDVVFDQKRFFTSTQPPQNDQTWWIPIFLYTNISGGAHEKTPLFWMPQGTKEITHKIPTQEDDVFLINPAQTGYYRVNYDQQTWKTIVETLKFKPNAIDAISTGQLIDDSMNLANAGLLDHSTAFQILDHLRNRTQYLPWMSAYRNILQLEKMLTIDPEAIDLFRKYLLQLTDNLYETYSSEKRKSDHTDYHDAQFIAMDLSCRIGREDCLEQAISKLNILQQRTMLTIRSETEQRLYCHALRSARQNEVDKFTDALETEENSQGRQYLLESLACVGTRKELERVMTFLVEEIGIKTEMARFLEIAAEHGTVGFETVVDFLTREKDQVDEIFGSKRSMEKLLNSLANRVVDQVNAYRLRQMMKALQIPADFETIINHKLNEQILWQERNLPLVRQTLQQYT